MNNIKAEFGMVSKKKRLAGIGHKAGGEGVRNSIISQFFKLDDGCAVVIPALSYT